MPGEYSSPITFHNWLVPVDLMIGLQEEVTPAVFEISVTSDYVYLHQYLKSVLLGLGLIFVFWFHHKT